MRSRVSRASCAHHLIVSPVVPTFPVVHQGSFRLGSSEISSCSQIRMESVDFDLAGEWVSDGSAAGHI
eukprot:4439978-Pyramimonas_sp.AAC.1